MDDPPLEGPTANAKPLVIFAAFIPTIPTRRTQRGGDGKNRVGSCFNSGRSEGDTWYEWQFSDDACRLKYDDGLVLAAWPSTAHPDNCPYICQGDQQIAHHLRPKVKWKHSGGYIEDRGSKTNGDLEELAGSVELREGPCGLHSLDHCDDLRHSGPCALDAFPAGASTTCRLTTPSRNIAKVRRKVNDSVRPSHWQAFGLLLVIAAFSAATMHDDAWLPVSFLIANVFGLETTDKLVRTLWGDPDDTIWTTR